MGVKRSEQDLAWFKTLLVCGEMFFFSFSRETMTELGVGVFVLDIPIFFFSLSLSHPFKLL